MLLVQVPWADASWRCPSSPCSPLPNASMQASAGPKTLLDWARQAALQIHRWLPDRYIVLVADSAFAAIEFLAAVSNHACVVTRLRLDANLSTSRRKSPKAAAAADQRQAPQKVFRHPQGSQSLLAALPVSLWYGRTNRLVEIASGTAFGIAAACPRCRSDGFSSAIPKASSNRRPSSPPTSTLIHATSSPGSSAAGRSKSPSRKSAPISASKPNVSGPTRRSCAPPRPYSACSPSSLCGPTTSPSRESSSRGPQPGIQKPSSPSATPSRQYAAKYGTSDFFMSRPSRDTIEIPRHIWQRMKNALAHAA